MSGPLAPASRRWDVALLALTAVLLVPVAVVDVPPLSDLPNHLARVFVLSELAAGRGADLPFRATRELLPNLGVDLPGAWLLPWLGVAGTGRALVALAVCAWAVGARSLERALAGRTSWRTLVAAALVWSEPLLLGYVGFVLGVAAALVALARLVRALEERAAGCPSRRLVGEAALLGLVAAIAHVGGVLVLGVAGLSFAVASGGAARERRARIGVLALGLAPALAFVGAWWLRSASGGGVTFATPGMILRALALPLTGLDPALDAAVMGLFALGALVLCASAWPARPGRAPLVMAVATAALAVVFPADVAGAIEVHGRFVLPAAVFGVLAAPAIAAGPRARALATFALGLSVARTLHLAGELAAIDAEARAIRELLARETPRGAALGVVWFFPEGALAPAARVRALATLHVPSLAVVDRRAHVPSLYALPGVQPMTYVGGKSRAHRFQPSDPGPDPSSLARELDLVWACGAPPALAAELRARFSALGGVGRCTLFATRRSEVAARTELAPARGRRALSAPGAGPRGTP